MNENVDKTPSREDAGLPNLSSGSSSGGNNYSFKSSLESFGIWGKAALLGIFLGVLVFIVGFNQEQSAMSGAATGFCYNSQGQFLGDPNTGLTVVGGQTEDECYAELVDLSSRLSSGADKVMWGKVILVVSIGIGVVGVVKRRNGNPQIETIDKLSSHSISDELQKLHDQKIAGIITDEEFEQLKKKLI
jgi:hypothetical protein